MNVDVYAKGVDLAARHVGDLGRRAAKPRRAFERIGREMEKQEAAYFRSEGAGSWPPLSIETEELKSGSQPLVASGRLRESLLRVRIGPEAVSLGTEVPYARFHQYGTRYAPKRPPVMPASPRLRRSARETIARYVVEGKT